MPHTSVANTFHRCSLHSPQDEDVVVVKQAKHDGERELKLVG
jgi:hypothetical protein